ncbi:MAG: hypothetical protein ACHWZW_06320 [Spirulina sp.]
MPNHYDPTALTSQFPAVPEPTQGSAPIGSPISPSDTLTNKDLAAIGQIAAELLNDPIALQHLCDRVYALLKQDLSRQQSR